jgi:hypothetical protein
MRKWKFGYGNTMLTTYLKSSALLRSKGYFDTRAEFLKISKKHQIQNPREATPKQLRAIREQMIKDRKFDFWIKFRASLWTVIITILFFSGLIYYIRKVFDF